MSYPSNYSWGSHENKPSPNQRQDAPSSLNNWQQFNSYQGSWQQQNVPLASQPVYSQQQGNWNTNSFQKSGYPQMNYKGNGNDSWSQPPQHPQTYSHQQEIQSQQFQNHIQYSNNPNQFFQDSSNSGLYSSGQQMNYNMSAASDPWNWGWEEPANASPSSSFSTNNNEASSNWNAEENIQMQSAISVKNDFEQSGAKMTQGMKLDQSHQLRNEITAHSNKVPVTEHVGENYDNNEKSSVNIGASNKVLDIKADNKGHYDAKKVENITEVNFNNSDIDSSFDIKSDTQSIIQSSYLSNESDAKTERLSPDPNNISLTTQTMSEFWKEKYENGCMDLKYRNNSEGLTPQWSVESQMSQDTASDENMLENSPHKLPSWEPTSGDLQAPELSQNVSLNNSNASPRLPTQNADSNTEKISMNQFQNTNTINPEIRKTDEGLDIERLNQQIIPSGNLPPPLAQASRSGENSGNNPYSLGQKLSNKLQEKSASQKQEVVSENDYRNLVTQMEKFSVSNVNSNQQVLTGIPQISGKKNQSSFQYNHNNINNDYGQRGEIGEETLNQETIPDNEERPGAEELRPPAGNSPTRFQGYSNKNNKIQSTRGSQSYGTSSDLSEVASRTDRNQYLETGRLEDQMESDLRIDDNALVTESMPPPGLSRLVPGEIQSNNANYAQASAINISTPPPRFDRMVLGQITENESGPVPDINSFRNQNTPPPGLHRMVPGQLTDDQSQQITEESSVNIASNDRRDDIPPPGFRRMIPGESSSPETQNGIQMPMDPREQRVVTGVAKDEIVPLPTNITSSSPTPANRLANQPTNPEEGRLQFQSERCETIGSDSVDKYTPNSGDIASTKLSKRKEGKDRERHREDISSDEAERDPPRRHERDSDYYNKRDRNREREDLSGDRYRDERERRKGRERVDWDRERRKESPSRYREDRNRRRDYREDRRRHKDYDYSDDDDDDDDADTNGYYSDRERRNMSSYRDDYDRGYSRRDDRARILRPEKSSKDTNEESSENSSAPEFSARQSNFHPGKSFSYNNWPSSVSFSLPIDIRGSNKNRRHGGYGDRERERDRDRDLDRERNRDRGKDRDRQSDYYRRRDDLDDYRDSQRSRPSSRNDSVQDYKHRSGRSDYDGDRSKEKDSYRGHSKRDREMFYPPGYNYDPAYYNYYYNYYENLRRTNPAAYAEWFRKYYASSQHGTFDGTYTEDRGSVHSGRSSANDDRKDRYLKTEFGYPNYQSHTTDQNYPFQSHSSDTGDYEMGRRLDSSLQMESIQRLTPAKFTTAHVKGSLTPRGQLVKILAHYPLDGQPATLEIHENLSCFDGFKKEFLNFPGPLVKGVTHKNNILRYCKQKIKDADSNPDLFDKESYKLIWELLILLIRQNGTVVGTDIAELLMCNRSSHVPRQQASTSVINDSSNKSSISEQEVTNQFRDYLIYGNTKEALEWAMKNGLWGHALFLASKMDQRTYASVMTRFANGLTMNDPLQTLYQLMSGKQPASVTCCADEKWGDWRPHLAMILSNSTARPDLDLKAVTTLGDTLGSRGNLHAAHFCYLMAQVEFGTFAHKSSKIVLIGSSHTQPFHQFANNEAIFATEIFEFACSLADADFALHHLQNYKLLMAKRLTEVGLVQEAVHYVEVIANTVAKFPVQYPPYFIQEVYNLGNMLKYFDPIYNSSEGTVSDPEWLLQLLNILNDYQTGVLQHEGCGSVSNLTTYSENEGVQNLPLDSVTQDPANEMQSWQNQQQLYYEQQQQPLQQQQQQQWHQNDQSNYGFHSAQNKSFLSVEQTTSAPSSTENSNQPPYWGNQNQWMTPQLAESNELQKTNENEYLTGVGVETTDSNQNHSLYNYYDSNRNEQGQPPKITLPGSVSLPKQRTVSQSSEDQKLDQSKPKSSKKESSKHNQPTGSWFGGIWNKLPFRPKNQMILPDDKNPSIVWDSDKNRWVNLNSDEDDSAVSVPPPPKASDLAPAAIPNPAALRTSSAGVPSPYTPNSAPGIETSDQPDASSTPNLPPSGPNKYKMTRGKSLRSNYVDVLNPGATKSPSASVPAPELFPSMNYSSQAPTNYFIPAPVEGNENAPTDFLSPSNPSSLGRVVENSDSFQPQALSRWSSTSSLSREVQKYTMKRGGPIKAHTQNTSSSNDDYYKGNGQWTGGPSRYPPNQTSSFPRSKGYPK